MRRFRLLALCLLALSQSGCAALSKLLSDAFQQPTFSFKQVQLLDVSLGGATVNLVYTLHNPNPVGLSLAEVDYALFIEGKQLVAGRPPNGLTIPESGQADLV